MKSSIDHVRELAARNSSLKTQADGTHEHICAAADAECARLSGLIEGVSHADVITDDEKATQYQSWVKQRAGLLRLLEGHHAA